MIIAVDRFIRRSIIILITIKGHRRNEMYLGCCEEVNYDEINTIN